MKRLVALLCCMIFLLAVVPVAQAQPIAYDDYSSIRNIDAVTMLTDLSLLEGDKSGLFRPDDSLTRAEVAKIAALVISPEPIPSYDAPFYDISRCWARDYISFCYERGFLAGYDDGSFQPNDPITARELVKMLLGAIGYDLSSYSGTGWDSALDALAEELHIYNGYELNPDKVISRDYAALLILNVLNSSAVAGYENGEPVYLMDDLLNPVSVLESRFGVVRYQQIITANEYANLDQPGQPLDEGMTKLYGHYPMAFSSALDGLGRTVTVYLRDGQAVGVPVYDPEEFCVTVSGQASLDLLFSHGGYTLAETAALYDNGLSADSDVLTTLTDTDTITLIDYESDNQIDLVLIYRWETISVLQAAPLVIATPEGNQVFPDQHATEDTVLALCLNDSWILCPF